MIISSATSVEKFVTMTSSVSVHHFSHTRCISMAHNPLTLRGCDLCASLVRPQNWPGGRWRRKEAERLPWSFKVGTEDAQPSPWTPWSPWSFEHVLITVAQRSPRTSVAHRSLKGAGGRHAHRRDRRMNAQKSATRRPIKKLTWRRHQMETFSALLALCAGNSSHKGQWRGALMFSLICARINGWINNGEAGDLRRYRVHYDVIVMKCVLL